MSAWRFEFRTSRRLWIAFSVIAFAIAAYFLTIPIGKGKGSSYWELVLVFIQSVGDLREQFRAIPLLLFLGTILLVLSTGFGWIAQAVIKVLWALPCTRRGHEMAQSGTRN